jgi:DnaJ domain
VSGPDPGFSWYDVLGVLPGASAGKIRRTYDAKLSLLRPELISGAPSNVVKAATRARGILEEAWHVLGDPVSREHYDEAAGFRRGGKGLAGPGNVPSDPGWGPADFSYAGGRDVMEVLGSLMALTDWLAPHPRPPGRIPVPDVRGLFYAACLEVTGRLGLQVTTIRLTEHPMPVDGLVVDQSPLPPATTRRSRPVTVQVWHPPVRAAGYGA